MKPIKKIPIFAASFLRDTLSPNKLTIKELSIIYFKQQNIKP